jgi:hypothetical protein
MNNNTERNRYWSTYAGWVVSGVDASYYQLAVARKIAKLVNGYVVTCSKDGVWNQNQYIVRRIT